MDDRAGQVAVVFVSQRNGRDAAGYAEASDQMAALAAAQPGYRGVDSVRDATGLGTTVSWWTDEAAALAWRAQADHRVVREAGRARWYDWYHAAVAQVGRAYHWRRDPD